MGSGSKERLSRSSPKIAKVWANEWKGSIFAHYQHDFSDWVILEHGTIPHASTPPNVELGEIGAVHALLQTSQQTGKTMYEEQIYPEDAKHEEEHQFVSVPVLETFT